MTPLLTISAKPSVRVADSRHGQGVFAQQCFKPGDIIGRVHGELIQDPDYASDYCADMGGDWSLEPEAPFRFLNHSCGPNCELLIVEDPAEPCGSALYLRAVEEIDEGQELTIDYAWPAQSPVSCECGHEACRGWIVSEEDLEEVEEDIEPALDVCVRQGKIGRGVYAARAYDAGETVGEVSGEVIDDPNYSSVYAMELSDTKSLEPAAPFRFLNHRCDPNCELVQWDSSEEEDYSERLWVVANRPIAQGEELTIDYAWPADWAVRCLCGALNCRGWVVDIHELELVAT